MGLLSGLAEASIGGALFGGGNTSPSLGFLGWFRWIPVLVPGLGSLGFPGSALGLLGRCPGPPGACGFPLLAVFWLDLWGLLLGLVGDPVSPNGIYDGCSLPFGL